MLAGRSSIGAKPHSFDSATIYWLRSYVFSLSILMASFAGLSSGHSNLSIRSEEHTSELQSLMRISYAVFCLKQKNFGTFRFPKGDPRQVPLLTMNNQKNIDTAMRARDYVQEHTKKVCRTKAY